LKLKLSPAQAETGVEVGAELGNKMNFIIRIKIRYNALSLVNVIGHHH